MKLTAITTFLALFMSGSPNILSAKTVVLGVGETYTADDLNVICVEQKSRALVELKECQFWDDFTDRCLYEKKIFTYGELECIEECQHWEKFNQQCHYATQCTFYPSTGIFVKTICEEFDDFNKVCKRTKQNKISDDK